MCFDGAIYADVIKTCGDVAGDIKGAVSAGGIRPWMHKRVAGRGTLSKIAKVRVSVTAGGHRVFAEKAVCGGSSASGDWIVDRVWRAACACVSVKPSCVSFDIGDPASVRSSVV